MLNQNRKNKIYVVGLGPGDSGQMTYEAVKAIQESDAVIGYKNYISWIKELLVEKKVVTTGMRAGNKPLSGSIITYIRQD